MPKKHNTKKEMTLDNLGRIVAEGFEQTASKAELSAIHKEVGRLDEDVRILRTDVEAGVEVAKSIRSEVQALRKETVGNEIDLRDIRNRVERLEKKVG